MGVVVEPPPAAVSRPGTKTALLSHPVEKTE